MLKIYERDGSCTWYKEKEYDDVQLKDNILLVYNKNHELLGGYNMNYYVKFVVEDDDD